MLLLLLLLLKTSFVLKVMTGMLREDPSTDISQLTSLSLKYTENSNEREL